MVTIEASKNWSRAPALHFMMHSTSGAWDEWNLKSRWRCCCERIRLAFVSGHSKVASRSALTAILRRMSRMMREPACTAGVIADDDG